MPSVKNLKILRQTGTDNTFYATWDFDARGAANNSTAWAAANGANGVRVGDWVTVKRGATWYNGAGIPDFVFNDTWRVIEVIGDRAVINENQSGTNSIESPISTAFLSGGTGGGSSSGGGSGSDSTATLDHYEIRWWYDTGDNVWFDGGSSTNVTHYDWWGNHWESNTYSPPENAINIQVQILPVSTTYKVNDQDVHYWTAIISAIDYNVISTKAPALPPSPTAEIDNLTLTATVDNVSDALTERMQFEICNNSGRVAIGIVPVRASKATYSCKIASGGPYRVRAKAWRRVGKITSDWTEFVDAGSTVPTVPTGISVAAASETSVRVSWKKVSSATSYKIEYAPDSSRYIGQSNNSQSVDGITTTSYEITELDKGKWWYFAVYATNDKGDSARSQIKGTILGSVPNAPTTWSSSSKAVVGDTVNLYWVHNTRDNSRERQAQVYVLIMNGTAKDEHTYTITDQNVDDSSDEEEKTHSYSVDTSKLTEGATISWMVRTRGVLNTYSPWSEMRDIDVYAPPTLALTVTDKDGAAISTVTGFPFIISALAGPDTQSPVSYHVSVKARAGYRTVDYRGIEQVITAGEEVYSRSFDTSAALKAQMTPASIDLQDNQTYDVQVTVAMSSSLTATASASFDVQWEEAAYEPNAEIGIDKSSLSAYVRPYAMSNGEVATSCRLAIYRHEYDGGLTEIATNLDPAQNMVAVDPHPSLYEPSYRIVATDDATGAISYYDTVPYPWHYRQAVIQWDEQWEPFAGWADELADSPVSGQILRLRWNLDVSSNGAPESSLVEYAGREHPVAYYGTQKEEKASWSSDVLKSDRTTLEKIRHLKAWAGPAYVREPSGVGFWASVEVSYDQTHAKLEIPVSISCTRVEGGM